MDKDIQNWADSYFTSEKQNIYVPLRTVLISFRENTPHTTWNSTALKENLLAWCSLKGYNLNPLENRSKYGVCRDELILKYREMIFIGTSQVSFEETQTRNREVLMGITFKEWANCYFSDSFFDCDLSAKSAFNHFNETAKTDWTMNRFRRALIAWSEAYDHDLSGFSSAIDYLYIKK